MSVFSMDLILESVVYLNFDLLCECVSLCCVMSS